MSVLIETTLGDIVVDLFVKERPRCCLNFLKLCKTKYFNFCLFHSVQRNFVAQTGDPTGTGKGGRSIYQSLYGEQARYFEAETHPKIKHLKAGTLSMVNDGNGFHGSQFLFTLRDNLDSLDGAHTVFGEIAEGLDVLMTINEVHCDDESRPYQNIRITHTVIIDDPLDDPNGLEIPDNSPERPSEEEVVAFRIEADEEINPDEDIAPEELKKKEETQEAQHHAQVLEIIGDIPDKDVKPPDNVLFVCKLNSITTSEDLEIIFSRFGQIDSCEIITDFKTGASLQYAFIEFESAEMCEKAYHKMDNVLIDDRRIHVDFSQSVSKMQYPQFWKRMKDNGYSTNQTGDDEKEKKENPSKNGDRRRHDSSDHRHHHQTSHRRSHSTANDRREPERRERRRDEYDEKNKKKKNKKTESEVRGGKHSKYSRVRRDDDDVSPSNHRRHNKDEMMTSQHRHGDHHRSHQQQRHHADDRHTTSRKSPKSKSKYDDKRRKEQKRKKKYNNSDTDDSSSYETEVRCGKHRKRDQDRR